MSTHKDIEPFQTGETPEEVKNHVQLMARRPERCRSLEVAPSEGECLRAATVICGRREMMVPRMASIRRLMRSSSGAGVDTATSFSMASG
jgi:hypothetical protein